MSRTNVPVLESVRAAFDFWRYGTPRAIGVLGAAMLVNLASAAVGGLGVRILLGLLGVLLAVMASGALLRLAFADEHGGDPDFRPGPMGFQWRLPEVRLLTGGMLLLFLFVIGLLFLLVLAFVCSGVAVLVGGAPAAPPTPLDPNSLSPSMRTTVAVLVDAFALVCIWVGVRVCLYPAATVAERRLMVFSTWGLTRGQFWRILACVVLVLLPALALTVVLASVSLPPSAVLTLSVLLSVVNAFLEAPLLFGLYAYLYRGLRPPAGLAGSAASV